jgi:hypothetical protein
MKVVHTQQNRGGDTLRCHPADDIRVDLTYRSGVSAKFAKELGQQKRVATRGMSAGSAQFGAGVVSDTRSHHVRDRGLAERLRAKNGRTGLHKQRREMRPVHVDTGSNRQRHHDRQTREPIGEVQQKAKRWFVGPLRVVDRKDKRAALSDIDDEPVETVQRSECDVPGFLRRSGLGEHRLGQPRRPGQQMRALGCVRSDDGGFQQLTNDSESESALEIACPCRQHRHAVREGAMAKLVQQRRLTDARRPFDEEDAPSSGPCLR